MIDEITQPIDSVKGSKGTTDGGLSSIGHSNIIPINVSSDCNDDLLNPKKRLKYIGYTEGGVGVVEGQLRSIKKEKSRVLYTFEVRRGGATNKRKVTEDETAQYVASLAKAINLGLGTNGSPDKRYTKKKSKGIKRRIVRSVKNGKQPSEPIKVSSNNETKDSKDKLHETSLKGCSDSPTFFEDKKITLSEGEPIANSNNILMASFERFSKDKKTLGENIDVLKNPPNKRDCNSRSIVIQRSAKRNVLSSDKERDFKWLGGLIIGRNSKSVSKKGDSQNDRTVLERSESTKPKSTQPSKRKGSTKLNRTSSAEIIKGKVAKKRNSIDARNDQKKSIVRKQSASVREERSIRNAYNKSVEKPVQQNIGLIGSLITTSNTKEKKTSSGTQKKKFSLKGINTKTTQKDDPESVHTTVCRRRGCSMHETELRRSRHGLTTDYDGRPSNLKVLRGAVRPDIGVKIRSSSEEKPQNTKMYMNHFKKFPIEVPKTLQKHSVSERLKSNLSEIVDESIKNENFSVMKGILGGQKVKLCEV